VERYSRHGEDYGTTTATPAAAGYGFPAGTRKSARGSGFGPLGGARIADRWFRRRDRRSETQSPTPGGSPPRVFFLPGSRFQGDIIPVVSDGGHDKSGPRCGTPSGTSSSGWCPPLISPGSPGRPSCAAPVSPSSRKPIDELPLSDNDASRIAVKERFFALPDHRIYDLFEFSPYGRPRRPEGGGPETDSQRVERTARAGGGDRTPLP